MWPVHSLVRFENNFFYFLERLHKYIYYNTSFAFVNSEVVGSNTPQFFNRAVVEKKNDWANMKWGRGCRKWARRCRRLPAGHQSRRIRQDGRHGERLRRRRHGRRRWRHGRSWGRQRPEALLRYFLKVKEVKSFDCSWRMERESAPCVCFWCPGDRYQGDQIGRIFACWVTVFFG
jgi:hypothetical protein